MDKHEIRVNQTILYIEILFKWMNILKFNLFNSKI